MAKARLDSAPHKKRQNTIPASASARRETGCPRHPIALRANGIWVEVDDGTLHPELPEPRPIPRVLERSVMLAMESKRHWLQ